MATATAESTVGKRIRESRKRAGLSQDRLAAAIGTTRQVIIRWEHDRHLPNASSRRKLAETLGQDEALFVDVYPRSNDSDDQTAMRERARELIAPFQRANGRRAAGRVPSARRRKKGRG
jgi:transcriptional regulator with XRE-family HTH domain